MCLDKNKPQYNRFMRIVRYYTNHFLWTGETIKKQETARLEKVIQIIMKECRYFQRSHGGWPIRDFIKEYLHSNNATLDKDNWDEDDNVSVQGDDEEAVRELEDGEMEVSVDNNEDVVEQPEEGKEPTEFKELDGHDLESIFDAEDAETNADSRIMFFDDLPATTPSTPTKAKKCKENILPGAELEIKRPQPKLRYKNKNKPTDAGSPSPRDTTNLLSKFAPRYV
ncbi:hypothetical protein C8F04DRAFT_1269893 [Mycena alexandri]|uniref:Uncharacterized protein n=1 Tax=Mycena alexandri TaxID=1745969 RepID=A0AAD6SDT6_9AGAR|nr:hypothetical protein C8F04DRAFT_1269893 [Mycena alexandri]